MKQLPNLFTLLNLFFGCIAIVFALQNGIDIVHSTDGDQFIKLTEKLSLDFKGQDSVQLVGSSRFQVCAHVD